MKKNKMEKIYRETPPEEIPWNVETPPKELVQLIERGKVKPCKAIDLGCGAGNYAIYIASKGFDVTGGRCFKLSRVQRAEITGETFEAEDVERKDAKTMIRSFNQ